MEKLRLVRFVGCVFVALGLGWGALVNALVDVTARSNPKVALQFDPDSAAALAAAATQKLIDNPASLDVKAVAAAARRSLQAQALNPGALALAGYAADMQGDTARADALIRTSERMTRRNLLAQLWLIENRVNAGDIAGALRHYDIALRVSDEAGPRLLPVLAGAMQQADVRRQLVAYLRAPWMPSLLSYATSNTDPRSVAAFIRQAGGLPRGYADPQLPHLLITTLVGKGFLQEARAYYFVSAKAGDATASDLAFSDDAADPAKPLGWQITDQDGVETSVQNGAAGEWELSIAVGSDAGGVVMQ
ncbi:MAG: hypothetical protein JST65_15195, partial [Acidobacteria bacterium]|nr:hypothetical protein [Acidobacteriota bacterium]